AEVHQAIAATRRAVQRTEQHDARGAIVDLVVGKVVVYLAAVHQGYLIAGVGWGVVRWRVEYATARSTVVYGTAGVRRDVRSDIVRSGTKPNLAVAPAASERRHAVIVRKRKGGWTMQNRRSPIDGWPEFQGLLRFRTILRRRPRGETRPEGRCRGIAAA